MHKFRLGKRSLDNLKGVDDDLVKCVKLAITLTTIDFTVIEGLRTIERQRELFAAGKSKTMNSYHLKGHAVDIVPLPVDWNNIDAFIEVSVAMKEAASMLDLKLTYGGDWKTFKDYPHYQIEK